MKLQPPLFCFSLEMVVQENVMFPPGDVCPRERADSLWLVRPKRVGPA
jgi:hypothetical protein